MEATFVENVRERLKGKIEDDVDRSSDFSDSSDEYVKGIHFNDGKEEMMNEFDEGFDEVLDNGQPRNISDDDGVAEMGKEVNHGFITPEMGKEYNIEEKYMTDEIDNGAKDDSGDDRPNIVRFDQEDEIIKDYNFKVGMELSSLKQFKSVILEHNVLNGRPKTNFKSNLLKLP